MTGADWIIRTCTVLQAAATVAALWWILRDQLRQRRDKTERARNIAAWTARGANQDRRKS